MSARLKVAIVGCGVAGSVLGYSLSRRPDVEVVCYERATPDDHSEAGTGLNVGPNAIKMLDALEPELARQVVAASYDWLHWTCSDTAGRTIFDFPLSDCADRPGIRIRWSELYRVLRAPLAGVARFGTQVLGVARDPARPATYAVDYRAADGVARRDDGFDLVVATDGRYSALRPQFAGAWTPRHVASCIFRLLVPDTSGGLMGDYAWWFNGNRRLLAFKVPPGQVYIAGSFPLPQPGAEIPAADKAPDAMARHFYPEAARPCPEVAWMVEQLTDQHDQIHWARLQETPPLFAAPHDAVLFLGDSAHGMVPTLGQGATQAVEDACVAAAVIRDALAARAAVAGPPVDLHAITAEISRRRLQRIEWVMALSLEATKAMLPDGEPRRDMGRLRDPEWQGSLTRLWSVAEPARILREGTA
ncbi:MULTISPECIES: FAD-dependent oxidoreductase [Ramlibacter]|uniref:FAD-dependent monooxygenase n=1 Tax=Ramlibacter pinisoli TaxID=2682844 RepID=A0A6N8IMI5_9BURK|nr:MULTISPECIES: NAD(P)/FAD-dependent oxidoreductase [Ramlibacter]MBA2960561.1 FAD-dependent monooxygenase [Ramlibacter sp. CGMCC 1.13660]MVQ27892.1 FAD-dependent monooxygenase [Ramlibacter pinisoli]